RRRARPRPPGADRRSQGPAVGATGSAHDTCADPGALTLPSAMSTSHSFCTSFSAAVARKPLGEKIFEGCSSDSVLDTVPERIALRHTYAPTTVTINTSTANTIESVPWMKVLRMAVSTC